MGDRVHPVAAAGFAAAAEVYERARPSYPQEAVDWIAERTGLGPGRTVADVGAGTGKLTRLLPRTCARVVAVEPLPEMRGQLGRVVGEVEVLDGTAESLPLPDGSADVVAAAQAAHWFDLDRALPEIHRVLVPGGSLVLLWNVRDLDDPFQRALEDLVEPLRGMVIPKEEMEWRAPLEASGLFGSIEERTFRHEQAMTVDDVVARVSSTSFVAAMTEPERAALLRRVRELPQGRPAPFPFPYVTYVFVSERAQETASHGTPPVSQPTRQ